MPKQWHDFTHLGVAVLELGAGRYEAALSAALEARALWRLLSPEDVVEAAVRCARPEAARAHWESSCWRGRYPGERAVVLRELADCLSTTP